MQSLEHDLIAGRDAFQPAEQAVAMAGDRHVAVLARQGATCYMAERDIERRIASTFADHGLKMQTGNRQTADHPVVLYGDRPGGGNACCFRCSSFLGSRRGWRGPRLVPEVRHDRYLLASD